MGDRWRGERQEPDEPDAQARAVDDHMVPRPGQRRAVGHPHVREQGGHLDRLEVFEEDVDAVIELVVADRGGVVTHGRHRPQEAEPALELTLRRPLEPVAAVDDHHRRAGPGLFAHDPPQMTCEARETAAVGDRVDALQPRGGAWEDLAVHVVGVQDDDVVLRVGGRRARREGADGETDEGEQAGQGEGRGTAHRRPTLGSRGAG